MKVIVTAVAVAEVTEQWTVDVDEETAQALTDNPTLLADLLAEGLSSVEVVNESVDNEHDREWLSARIEKG